MKQRPIPRSDDLVPGHSLRGRGRRGKASGQLGVQVGRGLVLQAPQDRQRPAPGEGGPRLSGGLLDVGEIA